MAPATDRPVIEPDALRPGDVLLSRGKGELSDLIVKVDGGAYSHSAVFDGEKLVQATTRGVVRDPAERSPERQAFVHVYRFHDRDGRELDTPGLPSRPVTEQALSFVGGKYAYDQLLLLAVLFYLRGRTALPYVRDIVRLLGGMALAKLRRLLEEHLLPDGRTSMICTELIAASFWKPSDAKGVPYGLRVKVWRPRLAEPREPSPERLREYEDLLENVGKLLETAHPGLPERLQAQRRLREGDPPPALLASAPGHTLPDEVIAGSALLDAGSVAPFDLETSPSLSCVGRLA